MVQPIDPSCLPVYRVKLPEINETPVKVSGLQSEASANGASVPSPTFAPCSRSTMNLEAVKISLEFEALGEVKALLRRCWNLLKEMVSAVKRSSKRRLLSIYADELLETSLRLNRLLNGDSQDSMNTEVPTESAVHDVFKKIPDSPDLPRSWSRAPIQELLWAIDTLDDIDELRSLANLVTQQYNSVGTTVRLYSTQSCF